MSPMRSWAAGYFRCVPKSLQCSGPVQGVRVNAASVGSASRAVDAGEEQAPGSHVLMVGAPHGFCGRSRTPRSRDRWCVLRFVNLPLPFNDVPVSATSCRVAVRLAFGVRPTTCCSCHVCTLWSCERQKCARPVLVDGAVADVA